jgi:hypothetical protein
MKPTPPYKAAVQAAHDAAALAVQAAADDQSAADVLREASDQWRAAVPRDHEVIRRAIAGAEVSDIGAARAALAMLAMLDASPRR